MNTAASNSSLNSKVVSIAMCTYNGEEFLRQQLDSLLAQTHRPLEIVICDDLSTDSTWEILNEYAQSYNFITIFRNKKNLGYVKNFETALGHCNGDYIALCDQDDVWLPEKISTQLASIGNYSLTYSAPSFIDKNGNPNPTVIFKVNRLSGRCPLALLFNTCVTGHLTLFKKEILNDALPFPDCMPAHDRWIPFIAAASGGIQATDNILSLYRIHGKNISRYKNKAREYNLIKNISRRRKRIFKDLEKRIDFLVSAKEANVLNQDEMEILDRVIIETKSLRHTFINYALKDLFTKNKDTLFPLHKKPKKVISRLSRGIYYYLFFLYLKSS